MAALGRGWFSILGGALLLGCAAQTAGPVPTLEKQSDAAILLSSKPAAGSTVGAPVNELKLRFNPPARLDEVTVSGPDGVMPTMVHSVGEAADYSIPLSGLGSGAYTVTWRATAQGQTYRGSFGFTVR